MQSLIKKEKKRPLSYEMLETLLPKWCRVTKYDALKNDKSLKEALKGAQMLVVLYNLHDRITHKLVNAPGHFVVINSRAKGQPTEYFSSMGWGPAREIAATHSNPKIFDRLLGKDFIHNSTQFQRDGDQNTCWRWVWARCILGHITLAKFQALFRQKVSLAESDDVITLMTILSTVQKEYELQ